MPGAVWLLRNCVGNDRGLLASTFTYGSHMNGLGTPNRIFNGQTPLARFHTLLSFTCPAIHRHVHTRTQSRGYLSVLSVGLAPLVANRFTCGPPLSAGLCLPLEFPVYVPAHNLYVLRRIVVLIDAILCQRFF